MTAPSAGDASLLMGRQLPEELVMWKLTPWLSFIYSEIFTFSRLRRCQLFTQVPEGQEAGWWLSLMLQWLPVHIFRSAPLTDRRVLARMQCACSWEKLALPHHCLLQTLCQLADAADPDLDDILLFCVLRISGFSLVTGTVMPWQEQDFLYPRHCRDFYRALFQGLDLCIRYFVVAMIKYHDQTKAI